MCRKTEQEVSKFVSLVIDDNVNHVLLAIIQIGSHEKELSGLTKCFVAKLYI